MGQWDDLDKYLSAGGDSGGGKVVWVSDGSGCADCAAKNGKTYDAGSAPECPAHPNCRCSLQPA